MAKRPMLARPPRVAAGPALGATEVLVQARAFGAASCLSARRALAAWRVLSTATPRRARRLLSAIPVRATTLRLGALAPDGLQAVATTLILSVARVLSLASILAASPLPADAANTAKPPSANTAPEPSGFWTGPINSAVPATLAGGKVINSARQLQSLLTRPATVIVDVSNAPRRPDNLATGAPWLPLPHQGIPGSLWIPGAGLGEIPPAVDDFFRRQLAAATDNDATLQVIIYCHRTCWLSWNAAKRAVGYGYRNVYWFRDGIEAWKAAHLPTTVIEPRVAPED
jgi:PQQ-dependent catabolism-associated CXXCW motif protein